jgi:tRNA/rRNA methyltransferase
MADPKERITVLLNETEGALNLGFIARAMANTGFRQLSFTGNLSGRESSASMYALHAADILDNAVKKDTFTELTAEYDVIIGFSPRNPWDDGRALPFDRLCGTVRSEVEEGKTVGLLFGNEANGLGNDHLSVCRHRVALPCDEGYISMNLAQAVLVVLWELRGALAGISRTDSLPGLASPQDKKIFLGKLRTLLEASGYLNEQNPEMRWREINLIFESRDWSERETALFTSFTNQILREITALKKS